MEKIITSLFFFLKTLPNNDCYLFGSLLNERKSLKSDIDLLILYVREDEPKIIREKLDAILLSFPIHIIFLTYEEEIELNFIQTVSAILINNYCTN
ncbi:nucleotidyltransferase domain-containing protein [uncultured Chryseobacterium sp.]|uniref:nucleotidyltransferase domain-containing protein n=1 Tax=uncultured Chryseobacterium sp. TaxID=259322 RepID=UPI0025D2FEFF|nr:nucleotidyltransferase domain-containing protein [uncultured Chryseobacterium sp.]